MAIIPSSVGNNSGSSGATISIAVGATLAAGVIVFAGGLERSSSSTPGIFSDSKGNTWTPISNGALEGSDTLCSAYSILTIPLIGSTDNIIFTRQSSGSNCGITSLSMVGALGIDSAVTAKQSGTSSTPTVTSGAPSVANELIIGLVGHNGPNGETVTQDSTNGAYASVPVGLNVAAGLPIFGGNFVYSGTSARIFAPTMSGSGQWQNFICGFKPSLPAAGFNMPMMGV